MKRFIKFVILSVMVFCCSVSFAYDVNYGDIVIFGNYEPRYGKPGYETAKYLSFIQEIAKNSGLYNHFFGFPIETWDDRNLYELKLLRKMPVHFGGDFNTKRTFWGHIDVITENKELNIDYKTWDVIVVLRPNNEMIKYVSINDMIYRYLEMFINRYSYNQPFIYVMINWIFNSNTPWVTNETYDLWAKIYNLNKQLFVDISAQDYITNDISSYDFTYRTIDCSSLAMWSIVYGLYVYDNNYRDLILNNKLAATSIDCVSPAQVGWWLYNYKKWVDIVDVLIDDNKDIKILEGDFVEEIRNIYGAE